jgi:hypothetical protein
LQIFSFFVILEKKEKTMTKNVKNKNKKAIQNKSKATTQKQFEIKDIYIIIFFVLITFLFFKEIILQQKFLWEDFIYQYYPFRNFATVSLSQGVLPHWNPYTFGGMPFIADIQTAFFYPLHLLLTIFVTGEKLHFAYLEYLLIFHYFMAGVFSYYLARSFDLNKWASILSGISFMFCGFMVTHAIHETMIIQFTYMPLIFMFYNKGLSTCKMKYILLTGLFMGIVVLCGHPQITLYMFFTFLLFGLYQIFFMFKDNNYKINTSLFKIITIAAFPFILGIMVGAIQLLPTMKLTELSVRSEISYEESLEGSLNYHNLITLFSPHFFGNSPAAKDATRYWGYTGYKERSQVDRGYLYWESCIYIGLSALVFGMLGIVAFWRQRIIKFLTAITLLSILYMLGDNFILYKLFYDFVPGFDKFRGIGRFGLIFAFSFSLLSAYGFDYFINNVHSEKVKKFIKYFIILVSTFILFWLLFQVGLLKDVVDVYKNKLLYDNSTIQFLKTTVILSALLGLVIIFERESINRKVCLLFFVLLFFVDFYIFGSQHNTSPENIKDFYQNQDAIKAIKDEYNYELFRVKARTKENFFALDQNEGMLNFIFMLDGYNPLNLKDRFPPYRTNDLMNVKYYAVMNPQSKRLKFEENETCMPRAWFSNHPIVESSLEKVSQMLEDSTFDIKRNVIIDQEPEIPIDTNLEKSVIRLTDYNINEIILKVETNENGILVLSEVYYPNWKVFVDDVEKHMLRANYSLRGVAIEKGNHTVVFKYVDKDFQLGAIIMFSALAIIIGGFIIDRYKQKKLLS